MHKIALTASAALLTLAVAAASVEMVPGVFALQGGTATTKGYLSARQIGSDPLARHIDTWLTPLDSAVPIRQYDVDMTKKLHMIVVSDDFRTFLHIHPALQPDGHFILDQTLPAAALYHVYADSTPAGHTKQVFRFDVDAGGAPPAAARDLSERALARAVGPYVVRLVTGVLRAGTENYVAIHVTERGAPARNLHPYLGALAHAVFLDAADLSYVHAHPMPMGAKEPMNPEQMRPLPSSAISAPDMMLHVALSEPGTYKLWLQFRGGSQLYVAPFVLVAR
jgi:hypothetical protein